MGPGIAAAFAGAGHQVQIWGRSAERAQAAARRAGELAVFLREEGLIASTAREIEITSTDELEAVSDSVVVVEAVAENLDLKRDLFRQVDRVCPPASLLATTTSGLLVTDIASRVEHRERVVAMHFWNPAHLMPIVEVCGGLDTSPDVVARAMALARHIGKQPVLLRKEVLGFLGTRMQQAVVREAIALLDGGVATAEDIDLAVKTSFGLRFPVIGPLETTDLSGLDVIAAIHGYLLRSLDCSTSPQAGIRDRVNRGELGVKSGVGFYDWSKRSSAELMRQRDQELVRRLRLRANGSGDI